MAAYYPYFRGKLNELIVIRETADLMSKSGFVPIIEPVKSALNGLKRTLEAIVKSGGGAIVIVNPHHGDFSDDGREISKFLEDSFSGTNKIGVGFLLSEGATLSQIDELFALHLNHDITLVHSGFSDGKGLATHLSEVINKQVTHVFLESSSGKLYRRHFSGSTRILIRDGFQKRKNREHPESEPFSDLHLTYSEEGADGFGDFLIVGDDYSESGGPAYAVAIHITFIDPDKDQAMFVHHFVSDSQDSPKDPAGKFGEALNKLVVALSLPASKILKTEAIVEFESLHSRQHFPGLGYVKKLSMQHHIQMLADHFSKSI